MTRLLPEKFASYFFLIYQGKMESEIDGPDVSTIVPPVDDGLVEAPVAAESIPGVVAPVLATNQPIPPTLSDLFQYEEDALFQYEVPESEMCFLCSQKEDLHIVIGGYIIRLYKTIKSDGKIVIYGRCKKYRGSKNSQGEKVYTCKYSVTYEEIYKAGKVYVVLKNAKNPDHRHHTCDKNAHILEGREALIKDIKEEMTEAFLERALSSENVRPEILVIMIELQRSSINC